MCKFPAYESCPISQAFPQLRGLSEGCKSEICRLWENTQGYDPQPTAHDWKAKQDEQQQLGDTIGDSSLLSFVTAGSGGSWRD
jgi:hypothetical protein